MTNELSYCNRTLACDLLAVKLGTTVTISGWVQSYRNHGGVIFFDIRDASGIIQIVFNPVDNADIDFIIDKIRNEYTIIACGVLTERSTETTNYKLPTGKIEVHIRKVNILAESTALPIPIDGSMVNEEIRLKYRYLDLRTSKMHHNLIKRHQIMQATRNFFYKHNFYEIETPILFKSTPEGAREYLVPSRNYPGNFYALQQSPQQLKQLLMIGGFERYFQIAKCFRDEDLRADRQPEFTQLDIEMSFVDREMVLELSETYIKHLWGHFKDQQFNQPFRRMKYYEAMNSYGSDKPDLRYDLPIVDVTDVFSNTTFKVFANVIHNKGTIRAINAKRFSKISSKNITYFEQQVRDAGAKGLPWIFVKDNQWQSPIVKLFSDHEKAELAQRLDMQSGDTVFFSSDNLDIVTKALGSLRTAIIDYGVSNNLIHAKCSHAFIWITDFPMFLYEDNRLVAAHHPFTAPLEDIGSIKEFKKKDITKVLSQHYDLVYNGEEIAGGSIRIINNKLQKYIFEEILQISPDSYQHTFAYFINAFNYGTPPHGGIAMGLDRIIACLCDETNIREVIAFPKTHKGSDLMISSPNKVTAKQLREANITISEE